MTRKQSSAAITMIVTALLIVALSAPGVWPANRAGAQADPCAGLSGSAAARCRGSKLPVRYPIDRMGRPDYGGGSKSHQHRRGRSLNRLHGPGGTPDRSYTLTAARGSIDLSGHSRSAITVNGTTPGPVVHARQGDLVQVILRNRNIRAGVTIHWHGLDVPNREDGVAGVTQDAVLPGKQFVYRFRADQAGTYWYHSHQRSLEQVALGFLGAVVVEPRTPVVNRADTESVAVVHTYGATQTINGSPGQTRFAALAGSTARIRFVNSNNGPVPVAASGPFRVAAIDGTEVNAPTPVNDRLVSIPAGGRADLLVDVGTTDTRLGVVGGPSLLVGPGGGSPPALHPANQFDALSYGTRTGPATLGAVDRTFKYAIGQRFGYIGGQQGNWYTINGRFIPDVPMFMVRKGDVVRLHYINNTSVIHPMHLHGHHALVVSRNGVAASGSPWWVDSLNVSPGDRYVLEFRADNPGIWMFHCHNLPHVQQGLMTHLGYQGIRTPYRIGRVGKRLTNNPE